MWTEETLDKVQHVKNCGVLFLHPYFNELFNKFSLLDNLSFKDEISKIKAVHFLYFLTTGNLEGEEDDFIFFKLLVGLEDSVFVAPQVGLTIEEQEYCTNILNRFIKKWEVLKSTSIETIQYNFLQRNGALRLEEYTMDVFLEKSVFDVLLEHYPYKYSSIELEWHSKLIRIII